MPHPLGMAVYMAQHIHIAAASTPARCALCTGHHKLEQTHMLRPARNNMTRDQESPKLDCNSSSIPALWFRDLNSVELKAALVLHQLSPAAIYSSLLSLNRTDRTGLTSHTDHMKRTERTGRPHTDHMKKKGASHPDPLPPKWTPFSWWPVRPLYQLVRSSCNLLVPFQ